MGITLGMQNSCKKYRLFKHLSTIEIYATESPDNYGQLFKEFGI